MGMFHPLFSYLYHIIVFPAMQAHPNMTLVNRNYRAEEYAKGGRQLSNWNVWVALETYMQVREEFPYIHPEMMSHVK